VLECCCLAPSSKGQMRPFQAQKGRICWQVPKGKAAAKRWGAVPFDVRGLFCGRNWAYVVQWIPVEVSDHRPPVDRVSE